MHTTALKIASVSLGIAGFVLCVVFWANYNDTMSLLSLMVGMGCCMVGWATAEWLEERALRGPIHRVVTHDTEWVAIRDGSKVTWMEVPR